MKRTLRLRREVLTELTDDELGGVIAAGYGDSTLDRTACNTCSCVTCADASCITVCRSAVSCVSPTTACSP